MTLYIPSRDANLNSYWLNIAIHFAREIGAHRYHQDFNKDMPVKHLHKLKRLWWSCIIRDRIIALGVRRPLRINWSNSDLDLPSLVTEELYTEAERSRVYILEDKLRILQSLSSLCELSLIFTDVLDILYPQRGCSRFDLPSKLFLDIESCCTKLDNWYKRTKAVLPLFTEPYNHDSDMLLFASLNYIYY